MKSRESLVVLPLLFTHPRKPWCESACVRVTDTQHSLCELVCERYCHDNCFAIGPQVH